MKAKITIEGLRKIGWKVFVSHGKDVRHDNKGNQIKDAIMTYIVITNPEGQHASGFSWSHPKDNYNRKLGNKIALGRALKNMAEGNFCSMPHGVPKTK